MAVAGRAALKQVIAGDNLRQALQQRIQQFRQGALALGLPLMDSPSAIQPIILGDAQTALDWSDALKAKGLWVGAIRPPTVPVHTARLRITLSAAHTPNQVNQLLDALAICQKTLISKIE